MALGKRLRGAPLATFLVGVITSATATAQPTSATAPADTAPALTTPPAAPTPCDARGLRLF